MGEAELVFYLCSGEDQAILDIRSARDWLVGDCDHFGAESRTYEKSEPLIARAVSAASYAVSGCFVDRRPYHQAYYAAYSARLADPRITVEDQLRRLFRIMEAK